ncbi:hypothetical protein D9613_012564 [Agrocybe pediades]|uniref:Uncharacterized protein n=1 Tax=Agrocybe pediades TaxID=84607 RepID=A0A8H4VMU2_9AGAR|nr:hypothetical protein D9613_012564 [Agrocybe pediades]
MGPSEHAVSSRLDIVHVYVNEKDGHLFRGARPDSYTVAASHPNVADGATHISNANTNENSGSIVDQEQVSEKTLNTQGYAVRPPSSWGHNSSPTLGHT